MPQTETYHKPVIAFRCDASPEIGTGHVMRCLSLAEALSPYTERIIFLSSAESVKTVPRLAKTSFEISQQNALPGIDWLVVDHYGLGSTYETQARIWARNIMVIDDLTDRPHHCDLLLDQTYGREAADYNGLVPKNCRVLAGPFYALLRPEFAALRETVTHNFEKPAHILVAFGGINPKSSTEITLDMLSRFTDWPLSIDVVTGANAHNLSAIEARVKTLNANGQHKAALHIDTPDMADLMAKADLSIGAGGTSTWERCCLKLPTVTLELAENQASVLSHLSEADALYHLGKIEELDTDAYLEKFSTLIQDKEKLAELSQNSASLCSGRGAALIYPLMMAPRQSKDEKNISLRYMEPEDCQTLFDWQNIPGVRQYARNPEPPSWEEHQTWFAAALENNDRHLFMIEYDRQPAGMVRLDALIDEKPAMEISILIDPALHKKGIASAALKLARRAAPNVPIKAHVLLDNTPSHDLFCKCGYKPVSDGWYVSGPLKS